MLRMASYVLSGRAPWSRGYWEYRNRFIRHVLETPALLRRFRAIDALPAGFGRALDERVVEYPWVFARLRAGPTRLLDAGSTLNHRFLLTTPFLMRKSIVSYTLTPEPLLPFAQIAYVRGDLRVSAFRDGTFDEIVCISTLDHVGMDNSMTYSAGARYREADPLSHLQVLPELRRLLRPGGRAYVTVPYGRPADLRWLQQFDERGLTRLIDAFGGELHAQAFYKYGHEGWQVADAAACAGCEYFDVHAHARGMFPPDRASAARAVACLEFGR